MDEFRSLGTPRLREFPRLQNAASISDRNGFGDLVSRHRGPAWSGGGKTCVDLRLSTAPSVGYAAYCKDAEIYFEIETRQVCRNREELMHEKSSRDRNSPSDSDKSVNLPMRCRVC